MKKKETMEKLIKIFRSLSNFASDSSALVFTLHRMLIQKNPFCFELISVWPSLECFREWCLNQDVEKLFEELKALMKSIGISNNTNNNNDSNENHKNQKLMCEIYSAQHDENVEYIQLDLAKTLNGFGFVKFAKQILVISYIRKLFLIVLIYMNE